MSKIYVCEYNSGEIECKRVFQEDSDEEANRFALRRAGGMRSSMSVKVIRDGQKIYQIINFKVKEKEGVLCLQNNKILSLNKSNIKESINNFLPTTVIQYLSEITGVNFNNESTIEQQTDSDDKNESHLSYYDVLKKLLF